MTEVFFNVLKSVQLLARVIERQDFPAGITGEEEAPVAAFIMTNVPLIPSQCSYSRLKCARVLETT